MEIGEVMHENVHASFRPLPKISLKHDWMKGLGPEVVQRPDAEVVQQSHSSRSSQPNPNPDHGRTVKLVFLPSKRSIPSRRQEIETSSLLLEEVKHDRTEKPPQGALQDEFQRWRWNTIRWNGETRCLTCCKSRALNVKRGWHRFQSSRIPTFYCETSWEFSCSWVKKIENHFHRHSLQHDLQQNEAYNPYSAMTKQMIQDVGNVEFFELFETDPKTQCTECLSYWSEGIVVMHHQNRRFCGQGWLIRYDARRAVEIHEVFFYLSE